MYCCDMYQESARPQKQTEVCSYDGFLLSLVEVPANSLLEAVCAMALLSTLDSQTYRSDDRPEHKIPYSWDVLPFRLIA